MTLGTVRRYLRFWGPDPRGDLEDELAFHIEMRVAEYVRLGMSRGDAEARVRNEAGDMDAARLECLAIDQRELRRQGMREALDNWFRDVRVALRSLRRSPGYFGGVVATLALGIGATTAIYSVVQGVLLNPLPYPDADRIVQVWQRNGGERRSQFSDPNFRDMHERLRSFESFAQFTQPIPMSVSGPAEPFRARGSYVSAEFFRVLGVHPIRGRTFSPGELVTGGARAIVITQPFWRAQLGSSEDVIGTRLVLGEIPYTVVGVMEASLRFPAGSDIFIPKELEAPSPYRTGHNWQVIGRVRDGVSVQRAQAELTEVAREMKNLYGEDTDMEDAAAIPLRDQVVGGSRKVILMLLASSGLLLLIACANVVNLLLARATARRSEIAVRLALGAGRGRLISQFLAESTVLALLGGVIGVAMAAAGVRALLRLQADLLPRASEVGINMPVVGFALLISLMAAVTLGIIGALRGGRGALRDVIAEGQRSQAGSGSARRLRDALVVTQIALAMLLLVGVGLFGRSFLNLFNTDPGYRTDGVLVMDVTLPSGNAATRANTVRFYDQVLERARAFPGVLAAGAVSALPLAPGSAGSGTFIIMGSLNEQITMEDYGRLARDPARTGYSEFRVVGGDYFRAMDIPLIRGRSFDGMDAPGAPHIALISESLARKRWPNDDPIGKIIQFGGMDGDVTPFTIVGIVGDVREENLAAEPLPTFYASYRQRTRMASRMNLVFRTEADPAPLITALRGTVRELRSDIPPRFRTMRTVLSDSLATRRFILMLIGVFGAAALALATLGVYSVISYLVAQRRREIAVRMALGARPQGVRRMVVREGAVLAGLGVVLGGGAALVASRYVRAMLYGVAPNDVLSLAAVAVILVSVALVASWVPARRAATIAPAEVLRS